MKISIKLLCLYLVQHLLQQIKAQQFYTDRGLLSMVLFKVQQKIVEFSRLLGEFPVLFKADLIFKDFSRKPSKFKYFSSLCKLCKLFFLYTEIHIILHAVIFVAFTYC